jgi:hypothetical protein
MQTEANNLLPISEPAPIPAAEAEPTPLVSAPPFSPPAEGDEEGWKNLYRQLGQPEDVDGYVLPEAEGAQRDEALQGWFKQAAYQAGLSAKQATQLAAAWETFAKEQGTAQDTLQHQQSEQALYALQKEWGPAFNDKVEQAKRAVTQYGISAVELDAIETALGTKNMLALCSRLGEGLKEPAFIGKPKETISAGSQAAKESIRALTQDKNFMAQYLNGDKAAVGKMQQVMKEIYG